MSAPMVRALLAGTKSQTRRIVKSTHADEADIWAYDAGRGMWESGLSGGGGSYGHGEFVRCPYGARGDRLWVRETFCPAHPEETAASGRLFFYAASDDHVVIWNDLLTEGGQERSPWKPSIHMPRAACRIELEVTGVRVERLQAISEADAVAEGISRTCEAHGCSRLCGCASCIEGGCERAVDKYAAIWRDINSAASWNENPWVWVVEFKRVRP